MEETIYKICAIILYPIFLITNYINSIENKNLLEEYKFINLLLKCEGTNLCTNDKSGNAEWYTSYNNGDNGYTMFYNNRDGIYTIDLIELSSLGKVARLNSYNNLFDMEEELEEKDYYLIIVNCLPELEDICRKLFFKQLIRQEKINELLK
jgi:hypothetical protein